MRTKTIWLYTRSHRVGVMIGLEDKCKSVPLVVAILAIGLMLLGANSANAGPHTRTSNGSGIGTIICSDGSTRPSVNAEISISQEGKAEPTINLGVNDGVNPIFYQFSGQGNTLGKIKPHSYSATILGASFDLCFLGAVTPGDISLSGKCGDDVEINYSTTTGSIGVFVGTVQCS